MYDITDEEYLQIKTMLETHILRKHSDFRLQLGRAFNPNEGCNSDLWLCNCNIQAE